jgi:hypothetical protein
VTEEYSAEITLALVMELAVTELTMTTGGKPIGTTLIAIIIPKCGKDMMIVEMKMIHKMTHLAAGHRIDWLTVVSCIN